MKAQSLPKLSVSEYIAIEKESDTKYEYHDGKIYALAGGTINHARLCGNVYSELKQGIKNKKASCEAFNSEVKLYVKAKSTYVYPDAMVVCGNLKTSTEENNSITNPILIIEVLSKSTAEYDRSEKFHLYRQIPSFQEYVLIQQDKYIVEVYYKEEKSDLWRITRYENQTDILRLASINLEISMKALYENVEILNT